MAKRKSTSNVAAIRARGKVKRSWDLDEEVLSSFDQWAEEKLNPRNTLVQLGLGLIMATDANTRELAASLMAQGKKFRVFISMAHPDE